VGDSNARRHRSKPPVLLQARKPRNLPPKPGILQTTPRLSTLAGRPFNGSIPVTGKLRHQRSAASQALSQRRKLSDPHLKGVSYAQIPTETAISVASLPNRSSLAISSIMAGCSGKLGPSREGVSYHPPSLLESPLPIPTPPPRYARPKEIPSVIRMLLREEDSIGDDGAAAGCSGCTGVVRTTLQALA
jgi:hypothetical protein